MHARCSRCYIQYQYACFKANVPILKAKAQDVGYMITCTLICGLCMCCAWSRYKMWVVGVEVRLRNEASAGVGHT